MSIRNLSEDEDPLQLNVTLIENMNFIELKRFLSDRLRGLETDQVDDGRWGDMPQYYIKCMYPNLNKPTKIRLENVVFDFLEDMILRQNSLWNGEPGSRLLLLIDPVLVDSPRHADAVTLLRTMIESAQHRDNRFPNFHLRILQALLGLRVKLQREFWENQYQIEGVSFVPIILEGLALNDVTTVFDWLANTSWNEEVCDAFEGLLPSLIDENGLDRIMILIKQMNTILPIDSKIKCDEICHRVEVALSTDDYLNRSKESPLSTSQPEENHESPLSFDKLEPSGKQLRSPREVRDVASDRHKLGMRGIRLGVSSVSSRTWSLLALSLAVVMTSLEQTVVPTTMPSIIAEFRSVDSYPWVFSAYLLAAMVSAPICVKLADLFGHKHVLLCGLGLFALGSVLSGLSQTMSQLIAMRFAQGIGAGAVAPIALAILGELFTIEERGRVQGVFFSISGVSSLVGPALGGLLSDQLSWRWVFFVTVPFAAVSALILVTQVRGSVSRREAKPIDWTGAFLLTASTSVLLIAVLHSGGPTFWSTLSLLALAFTLAVAFLAVERGVTDPLVSIDLLRTSEITWAIAVSFTISALFLGIYTFIPLFVQGVRGGNSIEAGCLLIPLFLSWTISTAVASKLIRRFGYRRTALAGSVLIACGVGALALGAAIPTWSTVIFVMGMVMTGLGFGPTSLSTLIAVQSAVPWHRRGDATASIVLFRTMGSALGVGVLGASLGFTMSRQLTHSQEIDVAAVFRPATQALLTPAQLSIAQDVLGRSLLDVFLEMAGLALLTVICAMHLKDDQASTGEGVAALDASRLPSKLNLGLLNDIQY